MARWAPHLVTRFFGSITARPLSADKQQWVARHLSPAELALWRAMSTADQSHALRVATRAASVLGSRATQDVVVAALLHDVGKTQAQLGTMGRVLATVACRAGIASGRFATYANHHEIGSRILAEANSAPLAVAWARQHELPPSEWTIDAELASALYEADDE